MIGVVFPGQGSQRPGMGQDLYERVQESRAVFKAVQSATMIDIAGLCFHGDEATLRETQNAQIALFTVGLAAWAALKPRLNDQDFRFAGHSLGEYCAVVASGALSIESGARLVQKRGEIMAASGATRPGTMAAVLGLDRDKLEAVCAGASTEDAVVVIANDNCPGQLVISGDVAAVEAASKAALEAGAKRALPLNVSGAFHSPLMSDSALEMGKALRLTTWNEQAFAVYANATGDVVEHGSEWAGHLEAQLRSPVRWTEDVQAMRRDGVDAFVECGCGEALSGLIRRIDSGAKTCAVNDLDTLETTAATLCGAEVTA